MYSKRPPLARFFILRYVKQTNMMGVYTSRSIQQTDEFGPIIEFKIAKPF